MTPSALEERPWPGSAVGHDRLGDHVWRVRFDASAPMRTLIAKSLLPEVAKRVEMVAQRWLPAVGLATAGPPLVRVVPSRGSDRVWHLYEDLGDWALDETGEDPERLRAIVLLIAQIHGRFVAHPLLGEALGYGRDLSAWAHESTLRGLVRALEAVRPYSADSASLRARLLARFTNFLEEAPPRAAMLRALGDSHTLLHGDLWPKNGIVEQTPSGPRARLVDWDRVGVGSAIYDVSTLLSRVPGALRGRVVEWYRGASDLLASVLISRAEMNLLAETCERTRLAEWSIWRVRAISSPDAEWAWSELARAEDWLEIAPLFPEAVAS